MLTPKLDLKNFTIQEKDDHCLIKNHASQQEYKLELVDALLLKCIDGSKDVYAIKNDISQLLSYEISDEMVWKAIDILSDIGILQSELAPPSGGQLTSRRGFLAKVAGTIAIGTAMTAAPAFAQSEEAQKKAVEQQSKDDRKAAEQNAKSPVALNSPATLSLLAIGAASMALINLRNKKNKSNNQSDD